MPPTLIDTLFILSVSELNERLPPVWNTHGDLQEQAWIEDRAWSSHVRARRFRVFSTAQKHPHGLTEDRFNEALTQDDSWTVKKNLFCLNGIVLAHYADRRL